METTVIIIKGDDTKSLMQDIANALTPVKAQTQSQIVERQKAPYTFTATLSQVQDKLINKFLNRRSSFAFRDLQNFIKDATGVKLHNKLLSDELSKKGYVKVTFPKNNTTMWIRSV